MLIDPRTEYRHPYRYPYRYPHRASIRTDIRTDIRTSIRTGIRTGIRTDVRTDICADIRTDILPPVSAPGSIPVSVPIFVHEAAQNAVWARLGQNAVLSHPAPPFLAHLRCSGPRGVADLRNCRILDLNFGRAYGVLAAPMRGTA